MRLAFFVNSLAIEAPNFTTTWLASEAVKLGHQVWYIEAGTFAYDPDDHLRAHAAPLRKKPYKSNREMLAELTDSKARRERLDVEDLDVLMLRNDPTLDAEERPWASTAGLVFGQIAARRGVLVLNDPEGLSQATNKLYLQQFPEQVRPATLVSRNPDDIRNFIDDLGGRAVLKPLSGSGGHSVFLVRKAERKNLNQMIDAVSREGYVIVQEYLPKAEQGDMRLFLLNGAPLEQRGKFAAILRKNKNGDLRSNMHAGGEAEQAKVTDEMLQLAELICPKLCQDGMHFVGLDIVGDKLMEINVFSPGGLYSAKRLNRVNFMRLILEDLQRKIECRASYGEALCNRQLATM